MEQDRIVYKIEEIKNKLIPICINHGIMKLGLFGSYARGEANENSDVDLLVEFDPSNYTFDEYCSLSEDLENALHKRYDIVGYDCISDILKDNILGEEVVLFESKQR